MTARSVFLVQMLDKLGAPLLGAVSEAAARKGAGVGPQEEAGRMAELLGRSVQISITLAEKMHLRDAGGDPDAVRLALTGLAAGLVAGHYRQAERAPDEGEIKRLVGALETVLTFADNFTPAAENTARLQAIVPGVFPADEGQIAIQYISALTPVVSEVAAFSFGRQEKKLMQDVAIRLMTEAGALRTQILGALAGPPDAQRAELGLLKSLAVLYAECHRAEKTRLLAMSDAERARAAQDGGGVLPMDALWKAFDARLGMMKALAENALPAEVAVGSSGGGPAPQPFPAAAPPVPPPAQVVPLPPAQEPPPADGGAYNPMSFFKGKKQEGGHG